MHHQGKVDTNFSSTDYRYTESWDDKVISLTYNRDERFVRVVVNGNTTMIEDIGGGQILYPCVVMHKSDDTPVYIVHQAMPLAVQPPSVDSSRCSIQ